MKDGTEIYFGGRMLLENIVPRDKADIEMLTGMMDRFAAKNNFEITDLSFDFIGSVDGEKE